jgi:predicted ATPase
MDVHGNLALFYGAHDPGCCSLGMRALSLMMLGYLEQAEAESMKSLEHSERLGHKPSISHTHMFRAEFCIILDRVAEADAHLRASISIAERYSLAGYLAADNIMQGWVRSMRGDSEAGVRQAEAALEALKSIPSRRFHFPIRTAIVGRARSAAGDVRSALAHYEAALKASVGMGERWYEPELLRLKAEMLVAQPDQRVQEAENCLAGAIAMAQRQDTKLWELRSAASLARLWATLGRRADALGLIAPIHGWFTEGFETADLRGASTLIAELSG